MTDPDSRRRPVALLEWAFHGTCLRCRSRRCRSRCKLVLAVRAVASNATDLARCFLRLANLPSYPLDRLSRYEAILCRQAGQVLLLSMRWNVENHKREGAGIAPVFVELCEAVVAVNDVKRLSRFGQERSCLFPFRSERQARPARREAACRLSACGSPCWLRSWPQQSSARPSRGSSSASHCG